MVFPVVRMITLLRMEFWDKTTQLTNFRNIVTQMQQTKQVHKDQVDEKKAVQDKGHVKVKGAEEDVSLDPKL